MPCVISTWTVVCVHVSMCVCARGEREGYGCLFFVSVSMSSFICLGVGLLMLSHTLPHDICVKTRYALYLC